MLPGLPVELDVRPDLAADADELLAEVVLDPARRELPDDQCEDDEDDERECC